MQLIHLPTHNKGEIKVIKNQFCDKLARPLIAA